MATRILPIVILAVLLACPVQAKNLYVSTTGSDSTTYAANDVDHPWLTVAFAWQNAQECEGTVTMNSTLSVAGAITGAMPIISDSDGRTVAASECYGTLHIATGAGTWTLPAVVAGMNLWVYSSVAQNIIIDCGASDHFVYEGTAESNGEALDSDDNAGEFIHLVGIGSNTWITLEHSAGWTGE